MTNQTLERFGKPKHEWSSKNNTFNVTVVNHFRDVSAVQSMFASEGHRADDGGQRWNVYAFIFPQHPVFAKFDLKSDDIWQPAAVAMPFHSGPSFIRRHFDQSGGVSCIQVGSDYNQDMDERYRWAETPEQAMGVFSDAIDLITYLLEYKDEE